MAISPGVVIAQRFNLSKFNEHLAGGDLTRRTYSDPVGNGNGKGKLGCMVEASKITERTFPLFRLFV